jgi:DsbC/DsbD-like thiol-disulfide interchange protein
MISKFKTVLAGIALATAFSAGVNAQILHPVEWSYGAKRISKTEAVIFLKATIEDGWHIYSAYQKEGGPVPTSFTFAPSAAYKLTGKLEEPKPVTKHEEVFSMDVSYFEHEVIFKQKVRLGTPKPDIKGSLKFMVCNDRQCLPPETVSFAIPVK